MQSSTTTIALLANYIKQRLEQLIWKQENPLGEEKEDSLSRERETHDFAKYYYFSMEMRSIKMNVRNVTPLVHTLLPFEYHKKSLLYCFFNCGFIHYFGLWFAHTI